WATQDEFFPIATVDQLQGKLDAAHVRFEFYRYLAHHAFANETAVGPRRIPQTQYDPVWSEQAWDRTLRFFGRWLVWAMEWQVIMRAPPDPVIAGADHWRAMWQQRLGVSVPMTILWNEHQTLDAKWRDGSIQDYATIRCAIYNVAGMLDPYLPS